jgi:glucose/arabinose dehydrogenase
MRIRSLATAAATAAAALGGLGVSSAIAAQGPPPPPKATGGQKVTMLAAGLHTPTAFAYGHGTLFEADGGPDSSKVPQGGVYAIKHGTATELKSPLVFSAGLAWHHGALYLSGAYLGKAGPTWVIEKWSGFNGTRFASQKVLYTAPKGFGGFNGIAFGPDDRLYVGDDVGLTDGNDHGPATTSPHVYEILSMTAAGKDVTTFASGIRQPWQMVFPVGSSSPLVSDLAPDKGKYRNGLDQVLKVSSGDDFGFPDCSPLMGTPCPDAPAAFATFTPHTDIMGLAIIGHTLYMSSFAGIGARAKAGEVLSMPLSGGTPKPVLTGFVAPVVGLGAHGATLYVGELTGQVFSIRP